MKKRTFIGEEKTPIQDVFQTKEPLAIKSLSNFLFQKKVQYSTSFFKIKK